MDATFHALGRILLNGVPTFLIVLLLVFYLRAMFFGPFARILQRRYEATEGAEKAAEESMREAERRIAEYEDKLRAARGEIYAEQDRVFRQLERELAAQMDVTRRESEAHVARAAVALEMESQEARKTLDARSSELADEIADRVLEGRAA